MSILQIDTGNDAITANVLINPLGFQFLLKRNFVRQLNQLTRVSLFRDHDETKFKKFLEIQEKQQFKERR